MTAIFKIDTDVVNSASSGISSLSSNVQSIVNDVSSYDTSAINDYYLISDAANNAKQAILEKISDLSSKVENTASHLTDVVSKHDAAQNSIKINFEEVDYSSSFLGLTSGKALNASGFNYSSISATGEGFGSILYDTSIGLSSSIANQKLTEEALEKFKNGDITADAAVKSAIEWALTTANDNSHGYSQNTRWGNPNYDCSSFVISAYEAAGIPVIEAGATYTGDMRAAFLKCGFKWVPGDPDVNSLQPGDILLDEDSHTEMYIGNGQNVGAHNNYDGSNGDSSGREISVGNYYSHPWDGVLRYVGNK